MAAKRKRRSRRRTSVSPSVIPLEERVLLADMRGAFAQFTAEIGPTTGHAIPISVAASDFTSPRRRALVGFSASSDGGSLDPGRVRVTPAGRFPRQILLQRSDTAGGRSSLTIASVRTGGLAIAVEPQDRTSGPYVLQAFLAGDADADFRVDAKDLRLIRSLRGVRSNHPRYLIDADVNRDGRIGAVDWSFAYANLGASTKVRPLTLEAGLDPASAPGGVVNRPDVTIVGKTLPGAIVRLDQRADGSFEQSVRADSDGTFRFNLVVTAGSNVFDVESRDSFGQRRIVRVTVEFADARDTTPPPAPTALDLVAASDSGLSDRDDVTNDPTPTVRLEAEAGSLVRLFVDGKPAGQLRANGLAEWTSGPLDEGRHTVTAIAEDDAGNVSPPSAGLVVTVDTTAPALGSFDLSPGSRTGAPEDRTSDDARVTLVGRTEPGARVGLNGTGFTALASVSGAFQIPSVPLAEGENDLTALATDVAGNSATRRLTVRRVASNGQADPVLEWNRNALAAVALDASDPLMASRGLAMMHAAIFDALNAAEGKPGHYVTLASPVGASVEAAVIRAAHEVLSYLYPAQQVALDTELASSMASVPEGQSKIDGEAVGRSAAGALIALRSGDGWSDFVDYVPDAGPGDWRPTAPMFVEALKPQWADMKPWAMTSPEQFLPAGPPDIAGAAWANDLNEVKSLGAFDSATRTADQTEIARFWTDGYGTYTPPGHWNQIASVVAQVQGNSLDENARLFAQLDVAMADAAIIAWNAKYRFNAWRPIAAVREADTTGNPAVEADPDWLPLLVTPNFPEYVSGHSTFSGAAAAVLGAAFGTSVGFSAASPTLQGVTRSYTSFDAAAEEAGRSRIYGGIHFEFSNRDGLAAGRALASRVLSTFNTAEDVVSPTVVLTGPPSGAATAVNAVIQGRVLDNLSGVTELRVAVDGGEFAPITFAADGAFSLPTTLALDGSADGPHVFRFRASDFAGNVSAETTLSITLDTSAPVITIAGPGDGQSLAAGAALFGTVDPTGSSTVALSYAIDGGPSIPMIFDPATGSFSEALDLSKVGAGSHALLVVTSDAAGNIAQTTSAFTLAAPVPLVVSSFTPSQMAEDVGPTFRPQVFFSRPVDVSTLNDASLFATGPGGVKVAATIAPAGDGMSAWVFFAGPLPGASTITMHVDGDAIRAAGDGAPLDGDGDGTPGGELTWTFSTASLAGLPGTSLSGTLADPGPDLKPGTIDDVRRGPDGVLMTADDVYVNPLAHIKVFILGREDHVVFTDASGRFELRDIPAGHVKLIVDGLTATNAPAGAYFPEMVMDLDIRPAAANTVMAAMQSDATRAMAMTELGVYLPRLKTSLLQPVNASQSTTITVDAASAPDLTAERRQFLTLEVQPGSILGADGQPLANPQIGISTVNSDFVRDMLPPAFRAQHQFEITIQAPGATVFTTPVRVTFPNLQAAAPGTKVNIFSFDHTTGLVVPDGTATVSADGRYVVSDPGSGIRAPGWHFVQVNTATPGEPCEEGEVCVQVNGGLLGDVIEVDLSGTNGRDFEFAAGAFPSQHGFVAAVDDWQSLLRNDGKFYFVPYFLDDDSRFSQSPKTFDISFSGIGRLATDPPETPDRRISFLVQLKDVRPGYSIGSNGAVTFTARNQRVGHSTEGSANPVTFGDGILTTYRIQQRLKFLGYRDADFSPLVVDGSFGAKTNHAIGLFNAVVGDTNTITPSTEVKADWVNAGNAPGWFELMDTGSSFNIKDGANQPERFGASWTMDVIAAATSGDTVEQVITAVSTGNGIGSSLYHPGGSHRHGLDVDVDFDQNGLQSAILQAQQSGMRSADPDTASVKGLGGATKPISAGDGWYRTQLTAQEQAVVADIVRFTDKAGTLFENVIIGGTGSTEVKSYAWIRKVLTTLHVSHTNGDPHDTHFHVDLQPPAISTPLGFRPEGLSTLVALDSTAAGFGTDDRLYYRFHLANGFEVAGRSDIAGRFTEFLAPNTDFTVTFFQASTNQSAVYHGQTNSSGRVTDIGTIILDQFGGPDADGDGLPDLAETAIGTDPTKADTDRDGISDDAEITQRLDPLDDRGFPTGIIASLPLQGSAQEVVVDGTTAYVASGAGGLAIVDVSRFNKPILLSQLALAGEVTDVAALPQLRLVAIATNIGGLQIFDVSTPARPFVSRTVNVNASRVEVADGVVYVADGKSLVSIDPTSGEILQSLNLDGGGRVTDIASEGSILYSMDSSRRLQVIDLSTGLMVARGSVTMPNGGGKLFVGNGIAYAAAVDAGEGGYATADVSDPETPVVLSGTDAPFTSAPGTAIVTNGSGTGLIVGQSPRVAGSPSSLQLVDVTDPTNTYNLLLDIGLPVPPSGVAVASGIAFIADGAGGLQVINYLPFDNRNQAPTITVSTPLVDEDPVEEGLQLTRGVTVPLRVQADDDVQVRSVELLVNGQVVATRVSFPWNLSAIALTQSRQEQIVTIQVRATDTGGNVGLSDLLTVHLLPDVTPPSIIAVTPPDGSTNSLGTRSARIRFSEPMAASSLPASAFRILDANDQSTPITDLSLQDDDRTVSLTFPTLPYGSYRLILDASMITDRVGNFLDSTPTVSTFVVSASTTVSNTRDSGPGSLREAILTANGLTGPVTIGFAIPADDPNFVDVDGGVTGGDTAPDVFVIHPQSPLPALRNPNAGIVIDGLTQLLFGGDTNPLGPEIVLDGSQAGAVADGLAILSSNNSIKGLVIGGFSGSGIRITGGGHNAITGNYIGTTATGKTVNANLGSGVVIGGGASFNRVGSDFGGIDDPGEANLIAFNAGKGIVISGETSTRNTLRRNTVYSNSSYPQIDLGDDGNDPIDAMDADSGPNERQNAPDVTIAIVNGTDLRLGGRLSAAPNRTYVIDFYRTSRADHSRDGTWIGTVKVTTDASGQAVFNPLMAAAIIPGDFIGATATDGDGNTSELGDSSFANPIGALEPNDTLATAFSSSLSHARPGKFVSSGFIGNQSISLASGLDVDFTRVDLEAGDRLTMDVDDRFAAFDSVIRLFDAQGVQLTLVDDAAAPGETPGVNPYLDFIAPSSGAYYLGLSGKGNITYDPYTINSGTAGSFGEYSFSVTVFTPDESVRNDTLAEAVDTGITATNPDPFSVDASIGDIPTGDPSLDVDLYRVQIPAGSGVTVSVDVTSIQPTSTLNSFINIFDESGNVVASSNKFVGPGETPTTDSALTFNSPLGGTYYVGVSGYSNTSYDPTVPNSGIGFAGYTAGKYHLEILIVGSINQEFEPNDSQADANSTGLFGQEGVYRVAGSISSENDVDYFWVIADYFNTPYISIEVENTNPLDDLMPHISIFDQDSTKPALHEVDGNSLFYLIHDFSTSVGYVSLKSLNGTKGSYRLTIRVSSSF